MTHEEFKEKFMPREVSYVKTHTVERSISALGAVNCKQGPIDAAVGALEKLIPASVKECPFIAMPGAKGNPPVMAAHLKCPVCNADVDMVRHPGYCGRCGQRIDWDGYDKSHWIDEVYYIDRRRE